MWKLVVFHTEMEQTFSMWDNNFLQDRLNICTLDSTALQSYALLQTSNKVLTVFSGAKALNCWIIFWLGKRPFQSEWRTGRTSVFCKEAISCRRIWGNQKSGLSLKNDDDDDDDLSVVSGGFVVSCSFSIFFFVLWHSNF